MKSTQMGTAAFPSEIALDIQIRVRIRVVRNPLLRTQPSPTAPASIPDLQFRARVGGVLTTREHDRHGLVFDSKDVPWNLIP
jgi:hypothetical protein